MKNLKLKERKGLYGYIVENLGIDNQLFEELREKSLFEEVLNSGKRAIVISYDSIENESCLETLNTFGIANINIICNCHLQIYRGSECVSRYSETPLTFGLDDKEFFNIDYSKCNEDPKYIFDYLKIELKERA